MADSKSTVPANGLSERTDALYREFRIVAEHGGGESVAVREFAERLAVALAENERLREALTRLHDATTTENFNRTGRREMSTNLRAALLGATNALEGGGGPLRGGAESQLHDKEKR